MSLRDRTAAVSSPLRIAVMNRAFLSLFPPRTRAAKANTAKQTQRPKLFRFKEMVGKRKKQTQWFYLLWNQRLTLILAAILGKYECGAP